MSSEHIHPDALTATRSSLLRRVRDLNDADGWAEFEKLYRTMLLKYARYRGLPGDAAEEIAQQCMTVIVSHIQQFQRKNSFRSWLRGMVDHKVCDYLAQYRKQRQADTDLLINARDPAPLAAELWQQHWDEAHLHHVLEHLRTNFARHTLQAFWLYVLQERPVDEISRIVRMTPNQVYVAKARVTRRIKEQFGDVIDSLYGVST
ncbi:MAG: sigma-70 family RNA polymerase sigma factor [Phycisphaerae bacterium]